MSRVTQTPCKAIQNGLHYKCKKERVMFRHRLIKTGSLVKWQGFTGVVTCVDPEERGDNEEVEVMWLDGDTTLASVRYLKVLNESR